MTNFDSRFIRESRNAFRANRGPSLSEVREANAEDRSLDPIKRRDLLSALNRIGTKAERPLSEIPATAGALRDFFASTNAVRMGVSEKTFRNIRSAAAAAVRRYGRAPLPITSRMPLTDPWRDLIEKNQIKTIRFALNRLAAYCSHMGIAPEAVKQDTVLGFYEALDAEEIVKNPRRLVKHTVTTWNRCSREIQGWPQARLESLFKSKRYTFALEDFPQSFQDEVAAWRRRVEEPDLLDQDALARPLRPATVEGRIMFIRRFASAQVHRGDLPIEEIVSLTVLMEPERFKSALRFFLERSGGEPTAGLRHLANAMRHIAKHWCKIDEAWLQELTVLCKRLAPKTKPRLTPKKRSRLQQFEDPENVRRLLCFPENQVAKARLEENPMKAARRIERALMVSLLLNCALRQLTLRKLELCDFSWERTAGEISCRLLIPPDKVKNCQELEFDLPGETVEILRLYLETYRPMLPGSNGPYLFPGVQGGMRSTSAVRAAIVPIFRKETGLEVNPHLFRHVVVKIAVERDPAAYGPLTHLLGHRSEAITRRHYMGSETKAAGRFLDAILKKARDGKSSDD